MHLWTPERSRRIWLPGMGIPAPKRIYTMPVNYIRLPSPRDRWIDALAPMQGYPTPVISTVGTLASSLIAFWELEEASGTRNDSHTNALHLTDNNTVTQTTGKVGNCAQFTNANQESLSRASEALLQTGDIDFTFCCWANATSLIDQTALISKYQTTSAKEYMLWYISSRFQWRVSADGSGQTTINANTLGAPSTATWYFIVCWHDSSGNTINIQVNDGTADSTAHSTGVTTQSSTFRLGAWGNTGTGFWDGLIDQAGFWKRLLTSSEKTYLYNSGAGRTYAEVLAASP